MIDLSDHCGNGLAYRMGCVLIYCSWMPKPIEGAGCWYQRYPREQLLCINEGPGVGHGRFLAGLLIYTFKFRSADYRSS